MLHNEQIVIRWMRDESSLPRKQRKQRLHERLTDEFELKTLFE